MLRRYPMVLAAGLLAPGLLAAQQERARPNRAGERPPMRVPEGVKAMRDLEYAKVDGKSLMLDLYLPEGAGGPVPLIVWVHGGAWRAGDKTGCPALQMVPGGYAAASISYRLSQEAIFPAQIHDCKAAIRWLRAHAKEYGIDPERIGAWGSSAGGHLVALLGTSGDAKELEGTVGGNLEFSSRVQAVCDWFGPTDFLQMEAHALPGARLKHDAPDSPESLLVGGPILENREKVARANPITYTSAKCPPFLIVHGDQDTTVPPHQSALLQDALKAKGIEATLYWVEGAGHGLGGPDVMAKVQEFFDRHLRQPWTVQGNAADRGGKPVAGARIVVHSGDPNQRTRGTTDHEGHFRLTGMARGQAFLFAEADGFRFHGQLLDPSTTRVEVTLLRTDEPAPPMRTLPPPLPRPEAQKLARQVLDPVVAWVTRGDQIIAEDDETIVLLARLDPQRARRLVREKPFTLPELATDDRVLHAVAQAILPESYGEAMAVVESMRYPECRVTGYCDICRALKPTETGRQRDLMARALRQAHTVKEDSRVWSLAEVADLALALGERDVALQTLRDAEAVAKRLPIGDWGYDARGALAKVLAPLDPPAALALLPKIEDRFAYERHHGEVAHSLAATHPAEAVRVLEMIGNRFYRDQVALDVCYGMAPVDLARAERLAASIEEAGWRAYTLGAMAHALRSRDKAAARRLLTGAFAAFAQVPDAVPAGDNASAQALALLPTVEQIAPDRLSTCLWQGMSLLPTRSEATLKTWGGWAPDTTLAMLLARYDRDVASALLAASRTAAAAAYDLPERSHLLCAAMALIDPRWAVSQVEAMPDDPADAGRQQRYKDQAREAVAWVLSHDPERLWQEVVRRYHGSLAFGEEDRDR